MPMPRINLMGRLNEARHWNDPLQFLDMVTNPWIPGNWYNPNTRTFNNPLQAFGLDRLFNRTRPGAFPEGLRPGQPLAPYVYEGPGSPGWDPELPGTQPSGTQPQGQGPLMSHQNPAPRPSGPGVRGGHVIASGQAAQNMVGNMRDGMREASSQAQARNAMEQMFRGSER